MLKKLTKFRVIGLLFLLSLLFILGGFFWAYIALREIREPLILHFNNLVGINQIGEIRDLLLIAITAFVVVAVNFFISLELEKRERFFGKLLAAATLFFATLIFIGFAAIISVN